MRSLEDLNNEVDELNLEIRKLLLSKSVFKEGIADKIAVVTTISTYRERIVKLKQEIRRPLDEKGVE